MKRYRRHFLVADVFIAAAGTLVLGVWMLHFGGAKVMDGLLSGDRATLFGTIASLLGSLLGFIIATLAILVAVVPDERLARVRESNQYTTVWRTLTSTMRWLAAGTVLALACLVLDRDNQPNRWLELLGTWSWAVAGLRLGWTVWIVGQVASLLSKP